MSEIYLTLIIANIKDHERQQKVSFLVDTGATRAWISEEIAEAAPAILTSLRERRLRG